MDVTRPRSATPTRRLPTSLTGARATARLCAVDEVVLPAPCLVVLVGAAGSGKSTWAAEHFRPEQVVSSDALRGVVGESEDDIAASDDAFELLDAIVGHRLRRRSTTVVDTLGLDSSRRATWAALARGTMSRRCVWSSTPLRRNVELATARSKRVPDKIIAGQVRALREQRDALGTEGFDVLMTPTVVRTVPRVSLAPRLWNRWASKGRGARGCASACRFPRSRGRADLRSCGTASLRSRTRPKPPVSRASG